MAGSRVGALSGADGCGARTGAGPPGRRAVGSGREAPETGALGAGARGDSGAGTEVGTGVGRATPWETGAAGVGTRSGAGGNPAGLAGARGAIGAEGAAGAGLVGAAGPDLGGGDAMVTLWPFLSNRPVTSSGMRITFWLGRQR